MQADTLPVLNPVEPVYRFQVGGVEYLLAYDYKAIAIYEAATGINPIIDGPGKDSLNLVFLLTMRRAEW